MKLYKSVLLYVRVSKFNLNRNALIFLSTQTLSLWSPKEANFALY